MTGGGSASDTGPSSAVPFVWVSYATAIIACDALGIGFPSALNVSSRRAATFESAGYASDPRSYRLCRPAIGRRD